MYGHPTPSFRNEIWERIERIGTTRRNQPWLIMGDFNELLSNAEKKGGRQRPEASFQDFRRMVRMCEFSDLQFTGDCFSWAGQRGDHYVTSCLDRTMATTTWHQAFPASETQFLELGESDHKPMVTYISDSVEERRGMFCYDSRLSYKEGFKGSVLKGWNGQGSHSPQITLSTRIKSCRKQISLWKKGHRINAKEKINTIRTRLNNAFSTGLSSPNDRQQLKRELNQAYIDEELFWKHKSRNTWIKEGDRNTKYFHTVTKTKRARNNITAITDAEGIVYRGDSEISSAATQYFNNLFKSSHISETLLTDIFRDFPQRVTEEINADLTKEVTDEEIRKAVFDIGPHKAPGPDGFTGIFYQQFWADIHPAIINEVKKFFAEGKMDQIHNHTNICLIPKTGAARSMADFRPISLCNVTYKIVSKILVSRLKKHLSGLISENQAAFIPGRMITDNNIIAHEVFYALKSRKRQSKSYMAIKTDITKAYDRLEWKFLETTMKHMGFADKWIQWIMHCVTTVSFSVLINGTPKGFIQPEKGLRQGDPLSPYLFILCAEVLSHLMDMATRSRQLHGIRISNQGPATTHLLFADDSLFFTLANEKSCKAIKKVLSIYESASGQAVNLRKSSITFGKRVNHMVKRRMRHILGIHNEGGVGKYLGLPENVPHKKTEMFKAIIDKVKDKTQGWSKKYLSQGGKEVLLKSVALALPVYTMNLFKLPKETCEEINSIIAKCWWRSGENQRGMHWFNWSKMGRSKKEGGMGFRDIEKFNLALLGKQVWRILQKPDCLMARILKARYFSTSNIFNAPQPRKGSYVWKSLLQGRDLLKKGMRFVIGDGSMINAWIDPWLPTHPPRPPRAKVGISGDCMVKDWILESGKGWDETKIKDLVDEVDVPMIMSIKLCPQATHDVLGWHYTKEGLYTVKSAYWLANQLNQTQESQPPPGNTLLKATVWKLKTAPKIQHFLWRLLSGALATGHNMRRRHIHSQSRCRRCCQEEETTQHLFFDCPYAQSLWRASGFGHQRLFDKNSPLESKMDAILSGQLNNINPQAHHLALWILWRLWKSRNLLVFQQRNLSWSACLRLAKCDAEEWLSAQEYIHNLNHQGINNNISLQRTLEATNWTKPPLGWIKCNYDGSFVNQRPSKAGWLFRDDKGCYLGAAQATGGTTLSALECEFQALIMAMQHVWSKGYRKTIFEGDCKQLVEIMQGNTLNFGVFNWMREAQVWSKRFEEIRIEWTPRRNNHPADILAKDTIPDNKLFLYHYYVPTVISNALHLNYVQTHY